MPEGSTAAAARDGLSYAERLREAASWNLLMTHLMIEAARLRREGDAAKQ